MTGESRQESYAQDGKGVLESSGLQVDTRPTYDTRRTRNMYVGESTHTGIYIDNSGELSWIFVSRREHEQAK